MNKPSLLKTYTGIIILLLLVSSCKIGDSRTYNSAVDSANSNLQNIKITKNGSQPSSLGSAEYFTGKVKVDPLFQPNAPSRTAGAYVTFSPGARSAWHSHPLGQTLIVTEGIGYVQQWGEAKQEIRKGDVIWTPPGVKHWHGATAASSMTHIAVQEQFDGKTVNWMEKVNDDVYSAKGQKGE